MDGAFGIAPEGAPTGHWHSSVGAASRPRFRPPTRDGAIVDCIATIYALLVIRSFRHKGLQRFFDTGSKAGIQATHAKRLARMLDAARQPADVNLPGWHLHALSGDLAGQWSIWVSGNWRLTFTFDGEDVILVDYQDYH